MTPSRLAWRLRVVQALLAALFGLLLLALVHTQVRKAEEFRRQEARQSLRRVLTPAPRGHILDREHRVLAGRRETHALVLHLGHLRSDFAREAQALRAPGTLERPLASAWAEARARVVAREVERAARRLGRAVSFDRADFDRHFARDRAQPYVIVPELAPADVERVAAHLAPDGPLQVETTVMRTYPHGHVAAHVLGRVRRELRRTASEPGPSVLPTWEWIGDWGIEKAEDARLRGRPAERVVTLDAEGLLVDPLRPLAPAVPGEDVVLSLDLDLQRAADQAMAVAAGGPRGAAVAVAVATGEVLALVSKPDFDLNLVSPVLAPATRDRIEASGGWLNRATQGVYAPGSSFKIFTALAGLRTGARRPTDRVYCDGGYTVHGHRFRCHNPSGHGEISLRSALAYSCNVYAYDTGRLAGSAALVAEARRFHLHDPTGLDLPHETTRMRVPDPANPNGDGEWTIGDTLNFAIGQGALQYSPLQAACALASLARRETLTVPTLRHSPGRSPTGERAREPLDLPEADYRALVEAMEAVVATGIGRDAQVPGVRIAGKTGTAQVQRAEGIFNVAWFVAFAPAERPAIAVAVALEGDTAGVEFAGAKHAAPVAREIIAAFVDGRPAE